MFDHPFCPICSPGIFHAAPQVKGEQSEGEAFTLDKGVKWKCGEQEQALSVVPLCECTYHIMCQITAAGLRESHPHDIYITKEAPNYTISPNG